MSARFDGLHARIRDWHDRILAPGSGRVVRLSGPAIDPVSRTIVVAGQSFTSLDEPATYALYAADQGTLTRITDTPGDQVDPIFAPARGGLLFRRTLAGSSRYEACFSDSVGGETRSVGQFAGSVEQAAWMTDGAAILLLVADPGVSLASIQGAVTTERAASARPDWYPDIDDGRDPPRRRLFLADRDGTSRPVATAANVWEACPAGTDAIAAIATDDPSEDSWYRADLRLIHRDGRPDRLLYRPDRQLNGVSADPAGRWIAVIDGLASDRGSLAGDLIVVDTASGAARRIDTQGVDVTWTGWSGERLVVSGIRSDDMAVIDVDAEGGTARLTALLPQVNGGQRYPALGLDPARSGDALAVLVEPGSADRLVRIAGDAVTSLLSLANADFDAAIAAYGADRFRPIRWTASDGETVEGWLHTPPGPGPFPLALLIHGGPIMRWLPKSLAEFTLQASLAAEGFAQFMPNPRGSTGRGQTYARAVLHDMGGRDARDLLKGVDHLVAAGIADPDRLFVTGISHGGFMTSWLVTQDTRFRAGAAVSPITDWTSQQLTSDIPSFNTDFIGDPPGGPPSPIRFADRVTARMLMIAGARDRCTPPTQAEEFHRAVRLAGGDSTLLVYPREGHGIRSLAAASIDHIARIIAFFQDSVAGEPA